jgi:hypothetical protein
MAAASFFVTVLSFAAAGSSETFRELHGRASRLLPDAGGDDRQTSLQELEPDGVGGHQDLRGHPMPRPERLRSYRRNVGLAVQAAHLPPAHASRSGFLRSLAGVPVSVRSLPGAIPTGTPLFSEHCRSGLSPSGHSARPPARPESARRRLQARRESPRGFLRGLVQRAERHSQRRGPTCQVRFRCDPSDHVAAC